MKTVMKTVMKTNVFAAIAGFGVTALLAGCQTGVIHGEKYVAESEPTSVGKFAQAQSAAGAKQDSMLFDQHFHGSELNSLGQGELDLIAKGTPTGDPVTVYLDMPHDQVTARQAAVIDYLKGHGLPEDKIIIAEGANPNESTPTALKLGSLYKADGTSYSGQPAGDSSSLSAASSTAGH